MPDPIDNQKYADMAGCRYDTPCSDKPPLIYGITHQIRNHFARIAQLGPVVLLTSFSDNGVTPDLAERKPDNVKHWFSNNVEVDHPQVYPVPIGFAYNVERIRTLEKVALNQPEHRTKLLYVNFTRAIPRLVNPRLGLYSRFAGLYWTTVKGGGGLDSIPPEEFYKDILNHYYVLSPPGAGLDCHRHWETMALGAIPIVLRSIVTERLLGDMPAMIVNSWDEITPQKLEEEWPRLSERFQHPCMRKMDMAYWRKVIYGTVRNCGTT